jgi:hypothetical protein
MFGWLTDGAGYIAFPGVLEYSVFELRVCYYMCRAQGINFQRFRDYLGDGLYIEGMQNCPCQSRLLYVCINRRSKWCKRGATPYCKDLCRQRVESVLSVSSNLMCPSVSPLVSFPRRRNAKFSFNGFSDKRRGVDSVGE